MFDDDCMASGNGCDGPEFLYTKKCKGSIKSQEDSVIPALNDCDNQNVFLYGID